MMDFNFLHLGLNAIRPVSAMAEKEWNMRSGWDRLRHAVLFEVVALLLVTPVAARIIGTEMGKTALFAIGMSTLAMAWNAANNWLFDMSLVRCGRPLQPRGFRLRAVHAVLFEAGLFAAAVPFAMVMLDLDVWQAVLAEIGLASFYMVFAYLYNWAYDVVFPVPVAACVSGE